jgi:transcriptional regulator with XRE-family HTH domain
MKERLLLFLNSENISATTLADEIGVQRSSISHIISGRNNPSYDFIYKIISRYDHLNAEWLITGKGDMYKNAQKPDVISRESERKMPDERSNLFDIHNNSGNFDIQEIEDAEKSKENHEINKVTNVNKIEKIVYFYKNGTFREYNPSE